VPLETTDGSERYPTDAARTEVAAIAGTPGGGPAVGAPGAAATYRRRLLAAGALYRRAGRANHGSVWGRSGAGGGRRGGSCSGTTVWRRWGERLRIHRRLLRLPTTNIILSCEKFHKWFFLETVPRVARRVRNTWSEPVWAAVGPLAQVATKCRVTPI
jgi:hypothetical protein